jgi:hypothetical protein
MGVQRFGRHLLEASEVSQAHRESLLHEFSVMSEGHGTEVQTERPESHKQPAEVQFDGMVICRQGVLSQTPESVMAKVFLEH